MSVSLDLCLWAFVFGPMYWNICLCLCFFGSVSVCLCLCVCVWGLCLWICVFGFVFLGLCLKVCVLRFVSLVLKSVFLGLCLYVCVFGSAEVLALFVTSDEHATLKLHKLGLLKDSRQEETGNSSGRSLIGD